MTPNQVRRELNMHRFIHPIRLLYPRIGNNKTVGYRWVYPNGGSFTDIIDRFLDEGAIVEIFFTVCLLTEPPEI